jgi:large subunit ribosomal protein L2
MKLILHP